MISSLLETANFCILYAIRLSVVYLVLWLLTRIVGKALSNSWNYRLFVSGFFVPALPFDKLSRFLTVESISAQGSTSEIRNLIEIRDTLAIYTNSMTISFSGYTFAGVWLCGLVLFVGYLCCSYLIFASKLDEDKSESSDKVHNVFESVCENLGKPHSLRLAETDLITSPALFGLINPIVLLPRRLVTRLSESELRHVFCHEIVHFIRKDNFWNLLCTVVTALNWFNPFAFLMLKKMRSFQELSCDNRAISNLNCSNRSYGKTIIRLVEHYRYSVPVPGAVTIVTGKGKMYQRIENIALNRRLSSWGKVGVVAASAFSFALVAVAAGGFDTKRLLTPDNLPSGWAKSGNSAAHYVVKDLKWGASIASVTPPAILQGFGTLMQQFASDDYKGDRIAFSAEVKTEGVIGDDWVGLWMRVDGNGPGHVLAFYNMQDRPIKGDTSWTKHQVVLDVADHSSVVAYGIILMGQGRAFIRNTKIERVEDHVPVTDFYRVRETLDEPKPLQD